MVNNYLLLRISLFIILFNIVKPFACRAQEKSDKLFIGLKAGFPLATSKSTFKTYWSPIIDVSLCGLKRQYSNLYAGVGFDYSQFYIGEWIHQLKSRLHIFNPNIVAGYDLKLLKRLKLFPNIALGYSWMKFTNTITPSKYIQSYMAKFGMLYLNNGNWKGQQIISEDWIKQSVKSYISVPWDHEIFYGYLWWKMPILMLNGQRIEGYAAEGFGGQYIFVLPTLNMVVVFTSGIDWNRPELIYQPLELLQQFILPAVR